MERRSLPMLMAMKPPLFCHAGCKRGFRIGASWVIFLIFIGLVFASSDAAHGQDAGTQSDSSTAQEAKDAVSLDLEQLANMDVKVTSASKKSEPLAQAPAAIYVLSGEDIRRGGFTTLPEALRMVPGLYVAQTDAHIWQVSARGFSDLNNNKMLVMVDGRGVYSPALGTVFWDVLDMPLENIERVEIIRGPGGTLWGANAVNGVINIITKTAEQTQGVMASSSASGDEGYATTVRYGGGIGSLGYSLYGRASYWEPLSTSPLGFGGPPELFTMVQSGARVDWAASVKDAVTVEGGSYQGSFGSKQIPAGVFATHLLKGDDVLTHWTHTFSERSRTEVLAYCDWYTRGGLPGEKRNSCDVEFQHTYQFKPRQSLIWGGTFFSTGDDLSADATKFIPEKRRTNVVSGFAQYEITLIPDRLRLLGGSKLEQNDYTGFEFQPQGRAVWTPNKWNTFWTAVSRSVRVPTRTDSDLDLVTQVGVLRGRPLFQSLTGNPDLNSEHIIAYEVGYRVEPISKLSLDAAFYYNKYNDLVINSANVLVFMPTQAVLESQFINGPNAQSHGAELSAKWQPVHRWSISGAVTETRGDVLTLAATPEHLFNIQSRTDLPHKVEFDAGVYHYSALGLGQASFSEPLQSVRAFNRIDVGAGWHLRPQWTFSVWGRNLASPQHLETRNTALGDVAAYVPRSLTVRLLWQVNQK
jgi:iron complex outermembrane receptor protein